MVAARSFVKIINVLRHYGDVEIFFELCAEDVTLVRFDFEQLFAAFVVEIQD